MRRKFKQTKPHESIFSSKAPRNRLIASLESYRTFLKEKQLDMENKEEIKRILESFPNAGESLNAADPVEKTDQVDRNMTDQTLEPVPETNVSRIIGFLGRVRSGFIGRSQTPNSIQPDVTGSTETPPISLDTEKSESKQPLNHISRLVRNLRNLEKLVEKHPKLQENYHQKSHAKMENNPRPKSSRSNVNEERITELAKPRKVILKETLENYRQLMSREKQDRIECELGKEQLSPEDLESIMRNKPTTPTKGLRDKNVELLRIIEEKLTEEILEEIFCEMKKKIQSNIVKPKRTEMVSKNALKLQNYAYHLIKSANGEPTCEVAEEIFQNFSALLGNYAIRTMSQAITQEYSEPKCHCQPLKAVQRNQDLLRIAHNLIKNRK